MKDKRVLITGIQGFTGRYMAAEMLSAGYKVFGLGSSPSDEPNYFHADLTDSENLSAVIAEITPDIVIHLAAIAFVGHGDPNAFYSVNLMGTRNLLSALASLAKKPEAVLLASSANIYGNRSEGILGENALPDPANDYAVSKLAMEYMANIWKARLPLIIARPFNYTGVGQTVDFLIPKIVAHFRHKSEIIELGNIDVSRDFNDVRSLVYAYRLLIEKKAFDHTVNICSGKTYTLRDVISFCERITGHSIEVQVNPKFVRANEVKTLCGDKTKLDSLIGEWHKPSLYETLEWMLGAD